MPTAAATGFKLPGDVPIMTVSRNSMGYWGANLPEWITVLPAESAVSRVQRPGTAARH